MVHTLVVHLYTKDDAESIAKVYAKLVEASAVYLKDPETLSWYVMQDHQDKRAFTIVERYQQASSLAIHVANPFYKEFGAFVGPLLEKPLEIHRFEELTAAL
ncbi:hypothetical protein HDU83_001246 [Entophlyctis luteolus]|nr:hypothetical protein HDU83_001246 [Entophlyctis luteolus]KAJ3388470.1 hypothetical protein HDU84_009744 [Entophlyctis sp. JEL0112]